MSSDRRAFPGYDVDEAGFERDLADGRDGVATGREREALDFQHDFRDCGSDVKSVVHGGRPSVVRPPVKGESA